MPPRPGITNALGCAVADLRHDFVTTLNRPLDGTDMQEVHRIFAEQTASGRHQIAQETVCLEGIRITYSADMQFIGQTHVLRVPLPDGKPSREELQRRFDAAYHERFRVDLPEIRANLVNLSCSVIGVRPALDLSALIPEAERADELADALIETRAAHFDSWIETPVYARERVPTRAEIAGPAILEQMDATTVIEPGCVARHDGEGNLIIDVGPTP